MLGICFSENFQSVKETQPFIFTHSLHQSSHFDWARLKELVRAASTPEPRRGGFLREPSPRGSFNLGKKSIEDWGSPEFKKKIEQAIETLDVCDARIRLSGIAEYLDYGSVVRQITEEISAAMGINFHKDFYPCTATLFLSSPEICTPYHIDSEYNFLVQIQGDKRFHSWDGTNREIVPATHLEEFWQGVAFRERTTTLPTVFHLKQGNGIYNPPFFPHEVYTCAMPSISLSLGYDPKASAEPEIHRVNSIMKKLHLHPAPIHAHPTRDWIKSRSLRKAVQLKNLAGR
ncbi:MAG: cupin domain-containing protein [Acidobacteriaceae bacterium]